MRTALLGLIVWALIESEPARAADQMPVEEVSLVTLASQLASGQTTSEALTTAYLARIAAMDRQGPTLRSIIALNPDAIMQARALDLERRAGRVRGPLHGIPILVKDNIETLDPVATTAGSLALRENVTHRDATVVAKLRKAGVLILGKTNLDEWAAFRSSRSTSGWSAMGGLVRNPYAFDRTACGSSGGSGAATAASFAAAALGTDTGGSVICPAAMNGVVGFKPTFELVSRTHVIPITNDRDTVGVHARDVRDAAIVFSAMVGEDPADPFTKDADRYALDYAARLSENALKGLRIGVVRTEMSPDLAERLNTAMRTLEGAGATLVYVDQPPVDSMGAADDVATQAKFKIDINAYLASTPATVNARTLDQLIAFNNTHAKTEMVFFGQEAWLAAAALSSSEGGNYQDVRRKVKQLARDPFDAMMKQANASILVQPTFDVPWVSDPLRGDPPLPWRTFTVWQATVAGYPHLTVPMGLVRGLPVGLSFIGPAFADAQVLSAGFAYEARAKGRQPPRYRATADIGTGLDGVH